MERQKQLVVIGGGAAGFFCAVNAARIHRQLKVTILERSSKLLSKVRISGGGRCNVTNACDSIAEMSRQYPRGEKFLKRAFHSFFTNDTIDWFEQRGVSLVAEPDGRMFPVSNSSQSVIDCLLSEAARSNVSIRLNAGVKAIRYHTPDNIQSHTGIHSNNNSRFVLELVNGTEIPADYVCVASGGYPKSDQFEWLRMIGHSIVEPVPSLFTFNIPGNTITSLMGISLNASVKISGSKLQEEGPLLITHWGFSGPAILKLSARGARILATSQYQFVIIVNWVPGYNEVTMKAKLQEVRFETASQKISNRNPLGLPARLWEHLLQQCRINEDLRWADLPARDENKLVKILCSNEFKVHGKTTFREEFVTAGGLSLEEVDVNTMQSKKVPGLFFAGEVLDVDGITGGYNFQNAWTTGWIAANGIVREGRY